MSDERECDGCGQRPGFLAFYVEGTKRKLMLCRGRALLG
jgi:hypothetical protein